MNAETFMKNATDPHQWLEKSVDLRRSADRLWESFFETSLKWAKSQNPEADDKTNALWEETYGYLTSAKLLYGLALETAFKAYILRARPSDITFKMSADGTGKVLEVEIKQFGVSIGSGHDLEHLGEKSGVFDRSTDPLFATDQDYRALREILRHLSEVVLWSGRYPIPIRSGNEQQIPPDLPAKVFGHYIRDWIDRVLDRYQAPLAPSDNFLERMDDIIKRHKPTDVTS